MPDQREAVVIAKLQQEYKQAGIKGNRRLAIGDGNNALMSTEQRKEIKSVGKADNEAWKQQNKTKVKY